MSETENAAWDRLESLRQSETRQTLFEADEQLRQKSLIQTIMVVNLEVTEVSRMSGRLIQIDRELRRTVSILDPIRAAGVTSIAIVGDYSEVAEAYAQKFRRARSPLPVPISVERGGLRVVDAAVGSTDFVVEAYGYLVNILVSQPVTAFTAALTLLDAYGRVRVWVNQRNETLSRIDSRNALRSLEAFRGDAARIMEDTPADVDIGVGTATFRHRLPRGMVRLRGGTKVSGRRITYIRINEDGTQDIIYVEG